MIGFRIVALRDMLTEFNASEKSGEDRVKAILSTFSCERNKDIECFLKQKAIEFDRQALARTYLVFASYREKWVLAGYFAIAQKTLSVLKKSLSYNLRKRINKFAVFNPETESYLISSPLIAQLGINDRYSEYRLISGSELLVLALEKVKAVQNLVGGKIVYLECEDRPGLIDFYKRNGFCSFGKRLKDPEEIELVPGSYLIQMLRYLED